MCNSQSDLSAPAQIRAVLERQKFDQGDHDAVGAALDRLIAASQGDYGGAARCADFLGIVEYLNHGRLNFFGHCVPAAGAGAMSSWVEPASRTPSRVSTQHYGAT